MCIHSGIQYLSYTDMKYKYSQFLALSQWDNDVTVFDTFSIFGVGSR